MKDKEKLLKEMYEQGKFDALADLEKRGKVVFTREEYESDLMEQYEVACVMTGKETAEKILNEIYTVLWDEKTPIADSFINLDVKIREIATREGVEIKE